MLTLRFGDGRYGLAPPLSAAPPGTVLELCFRTGNGIAGNVGAEMINTVSFCATKAGP